MSTTNFIDTATIWLHAGKGGDGAVSFHREKFVAAGGPDGGDGGRGGDILFVADDNLSTLMDFRYKRKYTAEPGENGRGARQKGRDAEDLVIRVPRGTVLKEAESGLVIADISGDEPSSPKAAAAAGATRALRPPPARSRALPSPACRARICTSRWSSRSLPTSASSASPMSANRR